MLNKKIVFLAVLVMVCMGTVHTQENALSLDLFPLFKGVLASDSDAKTSYYCFALGYERLVIPHFSIGANLDLFPGKFMDIDFFYLSVAATGRYYTMSEHFEKFFVGGLFGINRLSIDGKAKPENGGFLDLIFGLNAGYRMIFPNNLYAEPSMSYIYAKTDGVVGPLGWQAGLRIGYTL